MPVDINPNTIRIRVKSPDGFTRFRVKDLGKGIKAVIGFKAGGGSSIQSYIFDKKKWDAGKAKAWIKSHKTEASDGWYVFEYQTPIEAYSPIGGNTDDFWIQGTAINETITRNNIKYTAEELDKAAPTLMGKPILMDHRNEVEFIVGRVTDSFFDRETKSIPFKGKIMDKKIKEMVKDGRVNNVSIGARVRELVEGDNFATAKGIEIVELSMVAVPGDPGATFHQKLSESFGEGELKCEEEYNLDEESIDNSSQIKETLEVEKMSDEKVKELEDKFNAKYKELEEASKKLAKDVAEKEKKALIEEYKKLTKEKQIDCREDINELSPETIGVLNETLRNIKVKEQDDAEPEKKEEEPEKPEEPKEEEPKPAEPEKPAEEPKPEEKAKTKGLVGEEKTTSDSTKELTVETLNDGVALFRNPSESGKYIEGAE